MSCSLLTLFERAQWRNLFLTVCGMLYTLHMESPSEHTHTQFEIERELVVFVSVSRSRTHRRAV